MSRLSQISFEFFIFIGMAFLVAIAFEIASLDQLNDFRAQQESSAIKDIALKLQKELLIAANVEDGYVRIFQLPDKIDSINYSLTTQNSTVTVKSKNSLYIVAIPRIIGNVSRGSNMINKSGGVIYLNSIVTGFTDFGICQNAQNNGLCAGLDLVYGEGYKSSCCIEHSLCC